MMRTRCSLASLVVLLVAVMGCGEPEAPTRSAASGDGEVARMAGDVRLAAPAAESTRGLPTRPPAERATYRSVKIEGVPHVRQKPDFCGEACAEMALRHLGKPLDQDDVFDRSELSPLEGRGCYTRDLARALRNIGFKTGPVWHRVAVHEAEKQLESHWAALHADLVRGIPSIVCMRYREGPKASEHFRLVLGYKAETDEVIYHEPAEPNGAYRTMKRDAWCRLWPLKYERQRWTVVRLRLEPGTIRSASNRATFTDADYAQHIMQLKKKIAGEPFHMVIQPPFVVIGDESKPMVARRASGTVQWAVDRLKDKYFEKDPREILDIWLFKDKSSYERYTKQIFGEPPSTPFGYYSSRHRALVMNIATGGGTLVHEIVHPFVASNFPDCPAWFNEGLGSLYEQCGDREGQIHGHTNWRLAGLQRAIRAGSLPSFRTLCSTSSSQFYHADPGTNYAQARYLCYYLQEKGRLAKFYHAFRANVSHDPTGFKTLEQVLEVRDMQAFQKEWEAFVMKLRFPE